MLQTSWNIQVYQIFCCSWWQSNNNISNAFVDYLAWMWVMLFNILPVKALYDAFRGSPPWTQRLRNRPVFEKNQWRQWHRLFPAPHHTGSYTACARSKWTVAMIRACWGCLEWRSVSVLSAARGGQRRQRLESLELSHCTKSRKL